MKILYITSSAVPSQAANSVHAMKMCQAYTQLGHDVTLVSPEYNRVQPFSFSNQSVFEYFGIEFSFSMIKTQEFLKGKIGLLLHLLQLWFFAKRMAPDLIHSRCLLAACFLAYGGERIVYERHDSFKSQSQLEKLFNCFIRHKNFYRLIVISEKLKQHMMGCYNIPSEKIIVRHDGADVLCVNQRSALPPTGRIRIGYIGHLYKGRGIDLIIGLSRIQNDMEFHIVGGAPEDVSYWKGQVGAQKNIIFHGHVSHAQAAGYMMSYDILLAPYQEKVYVPGGSDTQQWMSPLKIFEYMATGKPIICSDLPVLREVLAHNKNCLLCPATDMQAWTEAINLLLTNKELAEELGRNAKKDLEEAYAWKIRARYIISAI